MSLFDFEKEDGNNEGYIEEIECQCESCSVEHTIEIVQHFMKKALESKNETELYDNLYEFAEMSKIQGIKEYLYEAIEEKTDILIGLDAFTKTIYDDNKDNR